MHSNAMHYCHDDILLMRIMILLLIQKFYICNWWFDDDLKWIYQFWRFSYYHQNYTLHCNDDIFLIRIMILWSEDIRIGIEFPFWWWFEFNLDNTILRFSYYHKNGRRKKINTDVSTDDLKWIYQFQLSQNL